MTPQEARARVLETAHATGARLVEETRLSASRTMLQLEGPAGASVIVIIGAVAGGAGCFCEHYVRGGVRWADLARDLALVS